VPLLDGALELATSGLLTSGDKTNREYVGHDVHIDESVDPNLVKLLFDPQTAGGMLISATRDRAGDLLERLKESYPQATVIGRVQEYRARSIVVTGK
jgi:selenide,water dikinase